MDRRPPLKLCPLPCRLCNIRCPPAARIAVFWRLVEGVSGIYSQHPLPIDLTTGGQHAPAD